LGTNCQKGESRPLWNTACTNLNLPQKDIIAEIILAIPIMFWLTSVEIALHRYLRISQYITVLGWSAKQWKKGNDDRQVGLVHKDGFVELAPVV
jgi:hypothetical protein